MRRFITTALSAATVIAGFSVTANAAEHRHSEGHVIVQTGHDHMGHRERRGRGDYDRGRDRGCERPSYRRGHSRNGAYISIRPGRSYIIIRAGDSCQPRRDRCR